MIFMKISLITKYFTMMASLMKVGERPRYLMIYKKMLAMSIIHIFIELIVYCGIFQNL